MAESASLRGIRAEMFSVANGEIIKDRVNATCCRQLVGHERALRWIA
jgi:hypothetical protein